MSLNWVRSGSAARLGVSVGTVAALMMSPGRARADEPRRVNEPDALSDSAEVTQVADAFDGNDLFDLHLSLGYQVSTQSANILRESHIVQPGLSDGDYVNASLNVAKYSQTTQRLNLRADVGVYKDIAFYLRLPIILNDTRKLTALHGSDQNLPLVLGGYPGEQLFSVPFQSPSRSGIEYLAVGLDAAIMNQWRDSTKPTWVVGLEGRFNVSEPMHACHKDPQASNQPGTSQVACADPSDYNRNGVAGDAMGPDGMPLEGRFTGGRKAGVSRGTTALELHTMLSKRIKYIEPYGGFKALFEFQNDSSDFGKTDLQGSLVNHPPLRGTVTMGLAVIPWEIRERYQRVTFDLRLAGTYVSEGRDYSELFDALGASDAPSLRSPNYAQYYAPDPNNPLGSVVDPNSQRVYFTGLMDVQQHPEVALSGQVTFQAGEYVKFNIGLGYRYTGSHFVTLDQSCNPDFKNDLGRAGACHSEPTAGGTVNATGIPNPNYRAVIDAPGQRFRVDGSYGVDGWGSATVMF
jgi:hypothetical protein